MQITVILVLIAIGVSVNAFQAVHKRSSTSALRMATFSEPGQDPLLLRAARGEDVERVPVWMMRQVRSYADSFWR